MKYAIIYLHIKYKVHFVIYTVNTYLYVCASMLQALNTVVSERFIP